MEVSNPSCIAIYLSVETTTDRFSNVARGLSGWSEYRPALAARPPEWPSRLQIKSIVTYRVDYIMQSSDLKPPSIGVK